MLSFHLRSVMVLSLSLLAATIGQAEEKLPAARQVIDDYLKAVGGKEEILRIKSARMKGTLTFTRLRQKAPFELFQAAPNRALLKTELPGIGTILEGFDGKVGWAKNAVTGASLLQGNELTMKQEDAELHGELRDDKDYKSMEVVGKVKFAGKQCYKVRLVRKSGSEIVEYYDVATKLRAGSERTMTTLERSLTVTTIVLEYKTFGKIKYMSKFRQTLPDTEVITEVTSVETNKVDDKVFELPAEIKALLKKK